MGCRLSARGTFHLGFETSQRAANRDPGGVRARLAKRNGNLAIAVPELDSGDDRFTFFGLEFGQSGLVASQDLSTDRVFERRRTFRSNSVAQFNGRRSTTNTAHLVADAIHDRLAEIRAQPSFAV